MFDNKCNSFCFRFHDELLMKSSEWKTFFSNHCVSTLRNVQAGKRLLEFSLNLPSVNCVSGYYQARIDRNDESIPSLSLARYVFRPPNFSRTSN